MGRDRVLCEMWCRWWGVECGGVLGNVEFYAEHGQLWDVELLDVTDHGQTDCGGLMQACEMRCNVLCEMWFDERFGGAMHK